MAGKIFINYRRGDDSSAAQALFGRLEQAFPSEQLFMDVDNIEPGLDFVRVLNDQVAQCDVLISIIGKNWVDARDEQGARRLDNPDDFVRIEIETALQQHKRVIPVLVGEARMPRADQLPDTMKPFARRNAVRLTHERFRSDTQALITALQRALKSVPDVRAAQAQAEVARQSGQEESNKQGVARQRAEAEAKLKAEENERRTSQPAPLQPARRPSRPTLLIGSSAGLVGIGVIVWLVLTRSMPSPVTLIPTPSPAPAPMTVSVLSPERERALKPKDRFKECADCPQMIVVPAGSFTMGSPASEPGRDTNESP
jgi:hypothetical protein